MQAAVDHIKGQVLEKINAFNYSLKMITYADRRRKNVEEASLNTIAK